MIAFLASFLLSRNPALAPAHARRLAKVGLVVAGVVLLVAGFGVWLWIHDSGVIEQHEQARELQAAAARETAADERLADAATNAASEKGLHDAIDAAPTGGELSPAARALSCERLRRVGRVPPACRRESDDGNQAAPD